MFYYKVHKNRPNDDTVLAVCDAEIAGETFSEGKLQLHIKKEFYCAERAGEEVIKLFESATIINLSGKKIVALAEKNGWLERKSIIKIKGVPHAQIIKM